VAFGERGERLDGGGEGFHLAEEEGVGEVAAGCGVDDGGFISGGGGGGEEGEGVIGEGERLRRRREGDVWTEAVEDSRRRTETGVWVDGGVWKRVFLVLGGHYCCKNLISLSMFPVLHRSCLFFLPNRSVNFCFI